MNTIVVIGSSNTDMVVKTSRFPRPGETIIGGAFFLFPGGKGANQAVAAARLDGRVTFIGKVGDDLFGRQALEGFRQEGIIVDHIAVDPKEASGVALITVDAAGENQIVVAPGANSTLTPEDIRHAVTALAPAAILLLQLEIPLATVAFAVEQASRLGKKVILNPAPAQALPDELLSSLFLITPNETEAEILTGVAVTDDASARRAAEALLAKGVQHVVITLGARGAFYCSAEQSFLLAPEKVDPVDTTAAGDVFNGALAVGLAEELDWHAAIALANRAAAISVTRMGAQASAPFRFEVR